MNLHTKGLCAEAQSRMLPGVAYEKLRKPKLDEPWVALLASTLELALPGCPQTLDQLP